MIISNALLLLELVEGKFFQIAICDLISVKNAEAIANDPEFEPLLVAASMSGTPTLFIANSATGTTTAVAAKYIFQRRVLAIEDLNLLQRTIYPSVYLFICSYIYFLLLSSIFLPFISVDIFICVGFIRVSLNTAHICFRNPN